LGSAFSESEYFWFVEKPWRWLNARGLDLGSRMRRCPEWAFN